MTDTRELPETMQWRRYAEARSSPARFPYDTILCSVTLALLGIVGSSRSAVALTDPMREALGKWAHGHLPAVRPD
jgi:hypothetical protein